MACVGKFLFFVVDREDKLATQWSAVILFSLKPAFVCWGIDPDGVDIWNAGGPGVTAPQARAANYSASHSKVVILDLGECAQIVRTKALEHSIDFPGFAVPAEKLH